MLLALAGAPRALAARRLTQAPPDETLDVCVVGAGPAGIGAALALTDKGKTVALLEREAVAGGQTAPEYRDPASGFRVHMGAVVITPPDCALRRCIAFVASTFAEPRCGHAHTCTQIPSSWSTHAARASVCRQDALSACAHAAPSLAPIACCIKR
jgi:phytoene dehydrogenase-like protein